MGGFFLGLQPLAAVSPFGPSFVLSGEKKNLLKKNGGKKMSEKKSMAKKLFLAVGSQQLAGGSWQVAVGRWQLTCGSQ